MLEVTPTSGLLPPHGCAAIEVTFCPQEEREHNYNLDVDVRRKPNPLRLNLKGQGYAVHVHAEMDGGDRDLALAPMRNSA